MQFMKHIAALATGLLLGHTALAQPLSPPVTINVSSVGLTTEGGLFTAIEKGYFKDEGITIKIIPGTTSNADTISQLVSGDLDIGVMNLGAAYINARERKVPIKAIVPSYVIAPGEVTTGVVIRKDLLDSGKFKSFADVKGLKLAVSARGNTSHYSILRAAEKAGLKQSDLNIVNMPLPDTIVAMGNKAIDGSFLVEPFITVANKQNIATLKLPEFETSAGLPSLMYAANTKFLEKNKEAAERFVAAFLKGQRDFRAAVDAGGEQPAMYATLAKYGQIKDVARLKEIRLPKVSVDGKFDPNIVNDLQDFLIGEKIISKKVAVNDLIDTAYLNSALQRLATQKN